MSPEFLQVMVSVSYDGLATSTLSAYTLVILVAGV
jgi:hypothetical protein